MLKAKNVTEVPCEKELPVELLEKEVLVAISISEVPLKESIGDQAKGKDVKPGDPGASGVAD